MKTIIKELVDIMNKDQVSFTEWFIDNYQNYIEKEKEQIIDAYREGYTNWDSEMTSIEYYNETYNNETIN